MYDFYSSIPSIRSIEDIDNPLMFLQAPADWYVIITDIKGSTQAINDGKYKEINSLSVASIVAVRNIDQSIQIPYAFGGDGATILVPPTWKDPVSQTLSSLRELAKTEFGLTLRVGMVPIQDIYDHNKRILVSKLTTSKKHPAVIFLGGGLSYGEYLIKNFDQYSIPEDYPQAKLNLAGFECRWEEIPTNAEEIVTLIVAEANSSSGRMLKEVFHTVTELYGDDQKRNPIDMSTLSININPPGLDLEARITKKDRNKIWLENVFAKYFSKILPFHFGKYKSSIPSKLDNEKIDDMLRMVISGTTQSRIALVEQLEKLRASHSIYYGYHISQAANLTCMVFDREDDHFHFIDGSDGGYALAARMLKKQMADN